jgi:hypothetical protein
MLTAIFNKLLFFNIFLSMDWLLHEYFLFLVELQTNRYHSINIVGAKKNNQNQTVVSTLDFNITGTILKSMTQKTLLNLNIDMSIALITNVAIKHRFWIEFQVLIVSNKTFVFFPLCFLGQYILVMVL